MKGGGLFTPLSPVLTLKAIENHVLYRFYNYKSILMFFFEKNLFFFFPPPLCTFMIFNPIHNSVKHHIILHTIVKIIKKGCKNKNLFSHSESYLWTDLKAILNSLVLTFYPKKNFKISISEAFAYFSLRILL